MEFFKFNITILKAKNGRPIISINFENISLLILSVITIIIMTQSMSKYLIHCVITLTCIYTTEYILTINKPFVFFSKYVLFINQIMLMIILSFGISIFMVSTHKLNVSLIFQYSFVIYCFLIFPIQNYQNQKKKVFFIMNHR